MFNPSYLTLSRHNVYYLRYPIPAILHPQGKQTDIKLSLGTREPKRALYLCRCLVHYAETIINNPLIVHMEYKEIRAVLHQHFSKMLENQKAKIDTYGRLDVTDKAALLTTVELAKQALEHDEDFCDFEEGYEKEVLTGLIKKYDMPIGLEGKDYQTLRTEFKIAYRDYCQQLLDHDKSFDNYAYSKPISLSAVTVEPEKPNIKLSDVIDRYIQNGTGQRGWTERTAKGYRSELNLILDFLGQDTSLYLTKQEAEAIQQMLCQIPKNPRAPKRKNLTIEELIELNVDEHPRMDIKTVKKYLSRYGSFYEWAGRHYDDLGRNYFLDLQKDIRVTDEAVRDPFTPEQIEAILNVVLNRKLLDHQKWGTLIALYTGARRNEIAQLELDDLREIDGIPCFDINDQSKHDNKKSLKTLGSKRVIPIHSKLLEYGLMEYAESVRRSGKSRLFPNLSYENNEGGYGRSIGRWINGTLLPELGIKSKSLVFHSFRHTMSAKLRNAGVSEAMADSITGHESKDASLGKKVYFKQGYSPKNLKEAIEKVVFP